ncbi:phospholipid-transporting ATPase ABCA3-like [Melitaea cinxia]|uniref:phospholipid-transporting ATPase ABCA3-like n=1 Tax=Melitaea cinxia TaxID=113334 RepID=UPI001E26E8E6|nr:phospholipid-transporting ATPase ABCA3-like [Melitaea cinxia]
MKGTLKVLLWKHLIVRIRRFIHTPIEIISPVILFIALFSFKEYLLVPSTRYHDEFNIKQNDPVELNSIIGPSSIFYTPETNLTSLLMSRVEDSLAYQEKYTNAIRKPKITPALNEAELQKFSKEVWDDFAFIIFQNVNVTSETWPEKLKYTIRMLKDFKTYSFRSSSDMLGPHEYFGTIYEPFMKLQWAIDRNYLELLTGNTITQRVYLQEFPYVRTKENQMANQISTLLKILCYLSLLLVFVFLMARLLEERISGIQELIKMVGVSNNALGISHVLNVVPAGLVYGVVTTVLVTVSSQPILPNTNPLLIFIMLVLHYITVIALAFCSSYIVNNTQYTETLAVLAYVLLYLPGHLVQSRELPRWTLPLCGLLPHVPMHWFWDEVAALQQYGMGLSFFYVTSSHTRSSGSVLACYLCLMVQAFLFFGLAWYLAKVRPGPYGQALPWKFLFQKKYWSKKRVTPDEYEELEDLKKTTEDPQYFEAAPKNMEVGIKIVNVSKVFANQRALSEVTLDVYKGEITVLLGHNGAGKTTLMSIITGMLKATEGNVYVEGLETVTQKDEMHKILGLCPQHNLFFPDLTVSEHVMFFTMLKGVSYTEATKSSRALLEQLGLADRSSYQSRQLSGGMKRRLQLACALAGDAKVLVLDEPTSGLDVETRRGLWDLLLSLRGSRTVLLSTHFMEEAEALGDRVAALHAGRLRCHATTMHLKRALGTGYRLSFTTIGLPDEPAITAVITSKIPEATVKETSLNSISYNLPSKSSDKFPSLFSILESKRSELGINSIGVGISTLEEVFLKLCSDVTTEFSEDAVDGDSIEPTFKLMTGPRLYFNQLSILIMRQLKYLWSKKISFLIIQVVIPILCIFGITLLTNNDFISTDNTRDDTKISLDLGVYDKMDKRRVFYSVSEDSLKTIRDRNPKVDFETTPDVYGAVLRTGKNDIIEYNKYLFGIELNKTDATILYTTVVRHAAPVALNLLTNMIATQLLPYADGQTITTYNHPIDNSLDSQPNKEEVKHMFAAALWAVFVAFEVMMEIGIPTKLVRLTEMTLRNSQSVVRVQTNVSEPFRTNDGLRQGDALSCLLFNIALDKSIHDSKIETKGTIYHKSVQILGYADDLDVLSKKDENSLLVFERKILRRIFGAVMKNEGRRTRYNHELYQMYDEPNVIKTIKIGRLRWAGHVLRMDNARVPKRFLEGRPEGRRSRGRPKLRWLDGVEQDIKILGATSWREKASKRSDWRALLDQAKVYQIFLLTVILTTVVNAVSLPCKERASGTRHTHVLSGCAPALHWAATLLTHALIYALVLVLPAVVICVAFERDHTIDRPDFLGAMAMTLMLGILAFLALVYIVSFNLGERGSSILLVAMVFIFGLFTPTIKSVSDAFEDEHKDFGDYVLSALSYSLAPHTIISFSVALSANLTEPLNYFSISDKTPGGLMIVLFVQFVIYMAIVILTQYGVFNMLFDRALNMRYRPTSHVDPDEMVRAERTYVEKAIALPKKQIQDAMLVNDLHKKYWRIFGKPCNAVQGVSFSVKKGECFGLLGVNGAGKSSTFKMMTGIEWPTRGSLFANGHFMSRFSSDYMQSLGYCPQFSGLDGFLTGYDNLKLLLTLRGLNAADVESEIKAWIETVGLEQYARRAVSGYSGGCARRLAAAAALSRGGAVTLLDEPTAGVDVAARRRVWAALRRAQPHRAVVVTSHSMDEMEALCGRIAIMAGGRVRALGEPAELRAAHAAGHAVLIKLTTPAATDVTDSSKSEVNRLKAALQQAFNCTLRDEHKTMLHYHIESPLRYSELFSELERLKGEFALFEDYSLTETTLEEVFLSLAREDGPAPV